MTELSYELGMLACWAAYPQGETLWFSFKNVALYMINQLQGNHIEAVKSDLMNNRHANQKGISIIVL
jgi:hypothetical protein